MTTTTTRAIAYLRVYRPDEQERRARNRRELELFAERQGLTIIDTVEAVTTAPGPTPDDVLRLTLMRMDAGEADVLLIPSVHQLGRLTDLISHTIRRALDGRWNIISVHDALDTRHPTGVSTAVLVCSLAEVEEARVEERLTRGRDEGLTPAEE